MSQKIHLRPLPTPEEIALAAANDWLGLLLRRNDLKAPFGVALSGGRIAKTFYEAVVKQTSARGISFESVHFFWADERCVPPSDPENNYWIARENLLGPLGIPEENIHRIRGELASEYAVQEAEAEICRILPLTEAGQPLLDLVILGMGEDGHVASLFPQESLEAVEDQRVFRKVIASKPPPERITLGYQPLIQAREVAILASGRGKAEALARLKAGDEALPVSRVVSRRSTTTVFHEIL